MTPLVLPAALAGPQRLPFYLAMEEWAACALPGGEYFFTWRVNPTVILGRNQQISTEVDLEYCRSHGIDFYRRRSGGGCVYADMDNIMMSYITDRRASIPEIFYDYSLRITGILQTLGLDAKVTGRNDITIGGRKVSGGAFYRLGPHSIVHSTMLFSTDMGNMLRAITPSRSKLATKQVASVASRITTVAEHLQRFSVEEFDRYIISAMASDKPRLLTEPEITQIRNIESKYYEPAWIYGAEYSEYSRQRLHIDGVGELSAHLSFEDDGITISKIDIEGDYFLLRDLDEGLLNRLLGVRYTQEDISAALEDTDPSQTIAGLDRKALLCLLFLSTPQINLTPNT